MKDEHLNILRALFPDAKKVCVSVMHTHHKEIHGNRTWKTYFLHVDDKLGSARTFIGALDELEKELAK